MRFDTDPMTLLRTDAENRINTLFNVVAARGAQQDHEHALKRALAQQVLAGAPASTEFTAAAAIEGLSVAALAAAILAKPDEIMDRANARRKLVLLVRQAKTPADLDAVKTQIPAASPILDR